MRATNFQIRRISFIPIILMQKSALNKFDCIENSNTEEERRFSSLDSPAGIRGGRFCNFDCKLFWKLQKSDRPSFPVCKENRWAAISPSLPNYSRRGREGRKGEKRGACRFNPFELRSKTSPQPSSSSVFIQLCGPASICLRSSYEISTGRAYTHKRFYPV